MTRIAVIGAGISGLATAYAIEQQALSAGLTVETRVFEKDSRSGGKIWSIHEDGFICEWGTERFSR